MTRGNFFAALLIFVVGGWALCAFTARPKPDSPFWLGAVCYIICFLWVAVHIWRGRQ